MTPRKKVKPENVLWNSTSGWNPTQKDVDAIYNRLKHTNQEGIFYLDKALYDSIKAEYLESCPDDKGSVEFKYYTTLLYLRRIFRENFLEFVKFLSNPERYYDFYASMDKYFKTGELSEMFQASANGYGGFFKHSEDGQIFLVELPRGIGKTTVWSCMRAVWLHIRNPEYKWLIASGDKEKAVLLLKSIQEMILNPYLVMVFPDLFNEDPAEFKSRRGNTLVKDKINIMSYDADAEKALNGDFNSSFRKEATFMICSPGIDRTSLHFEGIIADDLVTDMTSRSPEVTRALKSFFESLFALQEYHKGWRFVCYMTGTEWWENSLYSILENRKNVSIFRAPAKWYYNKRDIRLCDLFTDQFLNDQKENLGAWYDSQMNMIPRKYEGGELDLGFSDKNKTNMTWAQLQKLKEKSLVVQVCDPSFISDHKKEGDKQSRFTIINACVTNDKYYIYGGFQCMGKDIGGIKETNIEFGQREDIDFFIQDAQGIQKVFFEEQALEMRRAIPRLECKPHTKGNVTGGKVAVANNVLRELFLTGDIQIVNITDDNDDQRKIFMQQLKNEILGLSGMDIVDCIVYMVADIDRNYDVECGLLRKQSKYHKQSKVIRLTNSGKFRRLA